jgi:Protein of unknown function (DUF3570)
MAAGRRTRRSSRLASLLLATATTVGAAAAQGQTVEDVLTVRGAYFREASTRVVQPMLQVTKALPRGYDVSGHLLLDAITSASIAQGALTDEVFTENRYEGGVGVGWTESVNRVGAFVRYSREPDYFSHTAGVSASREVWGRTGTIGLNLAFTHDDIEPRPPLIPRDLDVWFAGLSYAQVLTPTTVAQAGYEIYYLDGFYGNPYISHPNLGREDLPETRLRHALSLHGAQYFPALTLGLQLHYRLYVDQESFTSTDPWGLTAHTVEVRLYKDLTRHLATRLSYRYHWQGQALFWCNARADIGCYGMMPEYHSWDVKFGGLQTHLPELKLIWDLHGLADVPGLDWLSRGSIEISYGYYFESTPYGQPFTDRNAPPVIGELPFTRSHGGAHLLQTGYSLPF